MGDVEVKAQLGDLFSSKSSASSNPVQGLTFAPALSVVTGAPNASASGSSGGFSSSPSATAPFSPSESQSAGFGMEPAAGIPGVTGMTGPAKSGTVQAGFFSGNVMLYLLIGAGVFLFLKFQRG